MIAIWMAYCLAVSSLLALAALALENGLRLGGAPLRWVWIGALLGSLSLSAIPWIAPGEPPASEAPPRERVVTQESLAPDERSPAPTPQAQTVAFPRPAALARVSGLDWGRIDRPLVLLWMLLSGGGILIVTGTHRRLRRRRRMWRQVCVDGVPALLSRDTGPAVVGFLDSAIVLPEWVLTMDEAQRRLVIAHEEEHLRAGDSRLLTMAVTALALMPWNAPLWWQVRRLRYAIELDCDARVMARGPDPRTYGALLIEIGQRASGSTIPIAAFSESSSSFLERRIKAMFNRKPRRWRALGGMSAILATVLVLFACEVPLPTMTEPVPSIAGTMGGDAISSLAPDGSRASTDPEIPDTVVVFLSDTVIKLRVRKPAELDRFSHQVCSFQNGDMGQLLWPTCGGYGLFGDGSVALSRENPVVGRMVVGSPAWDAGLRSGDVILSIDGRDARMLIGPFRNLRNERLDEPYTVRIRRGAEEHEFQFPVMYS